MRLYVAGPMTGLPAFNYPTFLRAEDHLTRLGYDVNNPAKIDEQFPKADGEPDRTWDWYMKRAIKLVVESDGVCVLPGWEKSKGARIEVDLASVLEIPVASMETWVRAYKRLQKEWGERNGVAGLDREPGHAR